MVFGDDVSPESGFPLAAAPVFGRTEGPQKSRFPEKGDKQKVWSPLALPQCAMWVMGAGCTCARIIDDARNGYVHL